MSDGAFCHECQRASYGCHCVCVEEQIRLQRERDEARTWAARTFLTASRLARALALTGWISPKLDKAYRATCEELGKLDWANAAVEAHAENE